MKHYIIVKFKDSVDVPELYGPIKELFLKSLQIEGVSKAEVHVSNTALPNRYDLMIEMTLTPNALKIFDNSELHKIWKAEYGEFMVNKVIFDCE